MRVIITDKNVGDWAAVYVARKINEFKPTKERPFVLGLTYWRNTIRNV